MGRMKREMLDREDHGLRAARLVDLLNQGTGVSCSCNRCGHRAEAATAVLVAQLGPDYPVPEIGARMRCGCRRAALCDCLCHTTLARCWLPRCVAACRQVW